MAFLPDILVTVPGVVAGVFAFLWFRVLELPLFHWLDDLLYGVHSNEQELVGEELANRWKHDYIKMNGVRLHYAHNGKSELPLMLFLHGFPEFWYSWRHQMEAFDADYHVVALDMRGYNTSSKPRRRTDYSMPCLVHDVQGVIESLAAGKKCVLVAHDWGGAIAWQTALHHPDLLSHLIILNAPYPRLFAKALLGGSGAQTRRSWYIFAFQLPWAERMLAGGQPRTTGEPRPANKGSAQQIGGDSSSQGNIKAGEGEGGAASSLPGSRAGSMIQSTMCHKERLTAQDKAVFSVAAGRPGAAQAMVNYYRNIFSNAFNARQAVPKVRGQGPALTVPTLVLWGEQDKFLGKELSFGLDRYVQDVTVKYFPGASHWLNQDVPEEVDAAMQAWLSGSSK